MPQTVRKNLISILEYSKQKGSAKSTYNSPFFGMENWFLRQHSTAGFRLRILFLSVNEMSFEIVLTNSEWLIININIKTT
jgi:hypothetical protein